MTEVIVTKALLDELHEQGWHLVTRREWYEMQVRLALLYQYEQGAKKYSIYPLMTPELMEHLGDGDEGLQDW